MAEGCDVAVLEAMKTGTSLKASCSGKILAISVSVGDAVGTGEALMSIG
ncbi:MAG: hypothetical protein HGA46_03510 [Chlorobiaceae bacterium]|nr:hypothetical protein [Chlorobiaceae bacterium]